MTQNGEPLVLLISEHMKMLKGEDVSHQYIKYTVIFLLKHVYFGLKFQWKIVHQN